LIKSGSVFGISAQHRLAKLAAADLSRPAKAGSHPEESCRGQGLRLSES
jgi:hypothetical protein